MPEGGKFDLIRLLWIVEGCVSGGHGTSGDCHLDASLHVVMNNSRRIPSEMKGLGTVVVIQPRVGWSVEMVID